MYKQYHMVFVFLGMAYFTQYKNLYIDPSVLTFYIFYPEQGVYITNLF